MSRSRHGIGGDIFLYFLYCRINGVCVKSQRKYLALPVAEMRGAKDAKPRVDSVEARVTRKQEVGRHEVDGLSHEPKP